VFKCEEKYVMGSEIIEFGGLNFFLVILNEKIIKYVIKFGRFENILEDH
jgi:hypothetical protein